MADNNSTTQSRQRLFVPVTRESLPRAADKYPFVYLEHGRLEIDDSSLKWLDAQGNIVRLPAATINCVLLGPGTSVTHAAITAASAANCTICWVGEDSLHFYAQGERPTANTRNMRRQAELVCHEESRLAIARAMYARRFPAAHVENKSLKELFGMEGIRVREFYEQMAQKYGVGWKGRKYVPGKFEMSDLTNKILTVLNSYLYALISSCVHSMGYSPHLGFIHSGSPLPLVYDFADLYKTDVSMEPAFSLTLEMAGDFNRYTVADAFRKKVLELDLLKCICKDLDEYLGEKNGGRYSK